MPPFPIDPEKDTIGDVIRRWAEVQPDAPAFLADGRAPLTYSGLVEVMDGVRGALNASGIGRGDGVGVVHSGGGEMAALLLGVLSGAAIVPLNPALTEDELTLQVNNCGLRAVIMEDGFESAARAAAEACAVPILDALGGPDGATTVTGTVQLRAGTSGEAANPGPARPEDPALVLVTSGTTSRNKIVPLRQAHVIARSRVQSELFELRSHDRSLNLRPLHYAAGVYNVTCALYAGGSIIFHSPFEERTFFHYIETMEPTWVVGGHTVLRQVFDMAPAHADEISRSALRFFRVGSGRLEPKVLDGLEALFGAPVAESYGATETGRITGRPLGAPKNKQSTVGIATNCEVRIISEAGLPLATGQRGEIQVRGPQVFDGYVNDDEANAEAFTDDWFHTGDEGVFDEDGYLTLTGRIKEVINRGGEKVSPLEVDAAIMNHPDVREAAAFPIPHPTLGEEVAAAVVAAPGASLSAAVLTKYLLENLSGFKVPRRFIFTDAIPKGGTGKVQRYKLAEELGVGAERRQPARKPTPLEHRLLRIWQRVLNSSTLGPDDNFFLAGGDSVQAVELFLQIERELGQHLPIAVLFEAGTVAEMARLIAAGQPQGAVVAIQPKGKEPPFFCVHGNGGEVIGFHNLARHLGQDQPFYGVQSIGWDTATPPFTDSAQMASHYVAEMRKVQPHGPYYLGGYSFGGRIAVYMAMILRAAGEKVALLALLDPNSYVGRVHATLEMWLERNEAMTMQGNVYQTARFMLIRTRKSYDWIYERLRRAVLFPIWNHYRGSNKPQPLFMRRPDRANRLVRLEHDEMPQYDGDAVYFRTDNWRRSMDHTDVKDSWDRIVLGELTVIPVPGRHAAIIKEPDVRHLARELGKALVAARAKTEG
jgi:acyl-CoA synthetase (AMP-forming)/AMP-acid ligase II/thioesterase domain-containing protein/acyl carrier protein